jgi:hypothetical protein
MKTYQIIQTSNNKFRVIRFDNGSYERLVLDGLNEVDAMHTIKNIRTHGYSIQVCAQLEGK